MGRTESEVVYFWDVPSRTSQFFYAIIQCMNKPPRPLQQDMEQDISTLLAKIQSPKDAGSIVEQLRKAELRGAPIQKRTTFVTQLFTVRSHHEASLVETWKATGVPVSLWPDANGLRIDIGAKDGVHSHIPYVDVTDELLDAVHNIGTLREGARDDASINPDEVELALRTAEARGDREAVAELTTLQAGLLHDAVQDLNIYEQYALPDPSIDKEERLLMYLRGSLDLVVGACTSGHHIPTERLRAFLVDHVSESATQEQMQEEMKERIMTLVNLASRLNFHGYKGGDGDELYRAQHPQAWRSVHDSHEPARFNKHVYKNRVEGLYTDPLNAEVSKILSVLFEQVNYEDLRALGIETVRGKRAGGVEFIGFWSRKNYTRVLIDVKKHIRGEHLGPEGSASKDGELAPAQRLRENYTSIPVIEHAAFESFEGLLLPYFHFQTLSGEVARFVKTVQEKNIDIDAALVESVAHAVEGMCAVLVNEMPPVEYEALLGQVALFKKALYGNPIAIDVVAQFNTFLHEKIGAWYGDRLEGKPISTIVEMYLKDPERVEVVYDEAYVQQVSPEQRDAVRAFLASLPVQQPRFQIVKAGSEHGMPYPLEAKSIRALGLKPAPMLMLVAGAAFEDVADQDKLDQIADALIEAGKATQANISMPGTLSGKISQTIVRKWIEYLATLKPGEAPAFQLVGFEPGLSIDVGNLGYPREMLKDFFPGLPINMILSLFIAGWSPGGDYNGYMPHVIGRQALFARISEGYPTATLIINGGGWSVPECAESAKDGFAHITVPSSGRLAALLGHLSDTRSAWVPGGIDAAYKSIETFITQQPDAARARMTNDLAVMKERGFNELLEQIISGLPITKAEPETLKDILVQALKKPAETEM